MKLIWVGPSLFLLLACAPVVTLKSPKTVDLAIFPRVNPHSQAIVSPYSLSSIATLSLIPTIEVSTGSYSSISAITGNSTAPEAPDALCLSQLAPNIDPSRPFILKRLKPNRKYRIRARAYDASNALISKDASSYVDVLVGTDDHPGMASLPVQLLDIPFAATGLISVKTEGRFDYLKSALFLVTDNSQISLSTTVRSNPEIMLGNLQANTQYRLLVEAYKQGSVMASQSVNFNVTNDNALATSSLSLSLPYLINTVAGNGTGTFSGDNGPATAAGLYKPSGLAVDASGNLYIGDYWNNRVRKVSNGTISTVAGNGSAGFSGNDGPATSAGMRPYGLKSDAAGNLYISDPDNHRIYKVDIGGTLRLVAGNGTGAYSGDDGPATNASIKMPTGLTVDGLGNIYIADRLNHRIRKVATDGTITTIAGNGTAGLSGDNGPATNAKLNEPSAVIIDGSGNLYASDLGNHCVRKIAPDGTITTVAGNGIPGFGGDNGPATSANLYHPGSIAIDERGNIFIPEWNNRRVRRVDAQGIISTVAGNGNNTFTGDGGLATDGSFKAPCGSVLDALGNLCISDQSDSRVRILY